MAVVYFKSPCVGPGCTYYGQTPFGQTTTIPDAHLAELDHNNLIVIEKTSEVEREEQPAANTLLREHDWLRKATAEENAEVLKLRQGEAPAVKRRSNVIPGTAV